ncbi:MAG: hypothetical protein EZS28_007192 [Streblomastix strix]|uniref:Uncharacterized protein n=1 Tax=Streblomastix strix TaxID=222440 RepID=A0A5J4WQN6_9EUKA|nr:MAG: hypothetical protein EZS28_007192 [Streblomastix strix]
MCSSTVIAEQVVAEFSGSNSPLVEIVGNEISTVKGLAMINPSNYLLQGPGFAVFGGGLNLESVTMRNLAFGEREALYSNQNIEAMYSQQANSLIIIIGSVKTLQISSCNFECISSNTKGSGGIVTIERNDDVNIVQIANNTILNSRTSEGSGGFLNQKATQQSAIVVEGSLFKSCIAGEYGGVFYIDNSVLTTCSFERCLFVNNQARKGGDDLFVVYYSLSQMIKPESVRATLSVFYDQNIAIEQRKNYCFSFSGLEDNIFSDSLLLNYSYTSLSSESSIFYLSNSTSAAKNDSCGQVNRPCIEYNQLLFGQQPDRSDGLGTLVFGSGRISLGPMDISLSKGGFKEITITGAYGSDGTMLDCKTTNIGTFFITSINQSLALLKLTFTLSNSAPNTGLISVAGAEAELVIEDVIVQGQVDIVQPFKFQRLIDVHSYFWIQRVVFTDIKLESGTLLNATQFVKGKTALAKHYGVNPGLSQVSVINVSTVGKPLLIFQSLGTSELVNSIQNNDDNEQIIKQENDEYEYNDWEGIQTDLYDNPLTRKKEDGNLYQQGDFILDEVDIVDSKSTISTTSEYQGAVLHVRTDSFLIKYQGSTIIDSDNNARNLVFIDLTNSLTSLGSFLIDDSNFINCIASVPGVVFNSQSINQNKQSNQVSSSKLSLSSVFIPVNNINQKTNTINADPIYDAIENYGLIFVRGTPELSEMVPLEEYENEYIETQGNGQFDFNQTFQFSGNSLNFIDTFAAIGSGMTCQLAGVELDNIAVVDQICQGNQLFMNGSFGLIDNSLFQGRETQFGQCSEGPEKTVVPGQSIQTHNQQTVMTNSEASNNPSGAFYCDNCSLWGLNVQFSNNRQTDEEEEFIGSCPYEGNVKFIDMIVNGQNKQDCAQEEEGSCIVGVFKGVLCDFNLGENFLNPALEKASLDKAIFDHQHPIKMMLFLHLILLNNHYKEISNQTNQNVNNLDWFFPLDNDYYVSVSNDGEEFTQLVLAQINILEGDEYLPKPFHMPTVAWYFFLIPPILVVLIGIIVTGCVVRFIGKRNKKKREKEDQELQKSQKEKEKEKKKQKRNKNKGQEEASTTSSVGGSSSVGLNEEATEMQGLDDKIDAIDEAGLQYNVPDSVLTIFEENKKLETKYTQKEKEREMQELKGKDLPPDSAENMQQKQLIPPVFVSGKTKVIKKWSQMIFDKDDESVKNKPGSEQEQNIKEQESDDYEQKRRDILRRRKKYTLDDNDVNAQNKGNKEQGQQQEGDNEDNDNYSLDESDSDNMESIGDNKQDEKDASQGKDNENENNRRNGEMGDNQRKYEYGSKLDIDKNGHLKHGRDKRKNKGVVGVDIDPVMQQMSLGIDTEIVKDLNIGNKFGANYPYSQYANNKSKGKSNKKERGNSENEGRGMDGVQSRASSNTPHSSSPQKQRKRMRGGVGTLDVDIVPKNVLQSYEREMMRAQSEGREIDTYEDLNMANIKAGLPIDRIKSPKKSRMRIFQKREQQEKKKGSENMLLEIVMGKGKVDETGND